MPDVTSPAWQALLWTLIHSLWQGGLAALAAGAVLAAARQASAALRYRLLVLTGLLFIAGCGVTLALLLEESAPLQAAPNSIVSSHNPAVASEPQGGPLQYLWQPVQAALDQYGSWILAAWLAVSLFKALQLLYGFGQVHRLRTRGLQPVSGHWELHFAQLARTTGLRKLPGFFESARVSVPLVVGCLKPLVLVPVGWLNALPPGEVEAILIHELAHIRRGDYIVNAIQHGVEVILFFNPGWLWVSRLIRQEREHCCDDEALSGGGDRRAYVSALLSISEAALQARPAMALNGGSPLKARVQRLLFQHHKNLSNMEKMSLMTALLATMVTAYAFAQSSPPTVPQKAPEVPKPAAVARKVPQPPVPAEPEMAPLPEPAEVPLAPAPVVDSPGRRSQFTTIMNDREYRIVMEDDRILELWENGKRIPENRYNEFQGLIQKMKDHQVMAREHSERAREHSDRARAQSERVVVHENRAKEGAERLKEHQTRVVEHVREMEAHEKRMEEHRVRVAEHAVRAEEHEVRAREHARRGDAHAAVMTRLEEEGLIRKGVKTIEVRDDKFFVDGKQLSEAFHRRYREITKEELSKRNLKQWD